jgi:hypothetical protein
MFSTAILGKLIEETGSFIQRFDLVNEKVSAGSIGWHIEHSFLTNDVIIESLKRSDPAMYKSSFSFSRLYVFTMKKIPRGRAQSPKPVRPKEIATLDTLSKHLLLTRDKINELHQVSPDRFFKHPMFGMLKLKPALRFLEIHTRHHLEIIRDITRK